MKFIFNQARDLSFFYCSDSDNKYFQNILGAKEKPDHPIQKWLLLQVRLWDVADHPKI